MNSAIEVIANVQMTWDRRAMVPFLRDWLLLLMGFPSTVVITHSLRRAKKMPGSQAQLLVHGAAFDEPHRPRLGLVHLTHHREHVEQHPLSEESAQPG